MGQSDSAPPPPPPDVVHKRSEHVRQPVVSPPPLLDEPWRKTSIKWSSQEYRDSLKESIIGVKPTDEMNITHYNILLLAPVGAGKTSFFNTVQSAFSGRISKIGKVGTAEKSMTLSYRIHPITDKGNNRTKLKFNLCDTPGVHGDFSYSDDAFKKMIAGHVKQGFNFDNAPQASGGYVEDNTNTKIHCVCFVFNASTFEALDPKDLEVFRKYQAVLNDSDIGQAIILTHIDIICPEAKDEDVKFVFKSRKIQNVVKKASSKFGIPLNQIHPIKNYEEETELVLAMGILTLYNLKMILDMCEDSVYASLE